MRRLALFLLVLAGSVTAPRDAVSQSPEVRASLERLWRARHVSSTSLSPLRDSLFRPSSNASRLAGLFLHQHAAAADGNADALFSTERDLGRFAQEHRDWPWAWTMLAEARVQLTQTARISKAGPLQPEGATWAEGAAAAADRALELDSLFTPAAEVLLQLLHTPGFAVDSTAVLSLVTRMTDGPGQVPSSLLIGRFELEAANGIGPAAENTFRRIQSQRGDSASRAAAAAAALANARKNLVADSLELAGTLLAGYLEAGGDTAVYDFEAAALCFARALADSASRLYYQGAGRLARDSMARSLYRNDIHLIGDSAELAAFDLLPPDSLRGWLEYFWSARDARSGHPIGARLAEHRRRVLYARRNYSRPAGVKVRSWLWNTRPEQLERETRPASLPEQETTAASLLDAFTRVGTAGEHPSGVFDDRGLTYIRHGPPDRTARYAGLAYLYSESWLYRRPVAPLVLHFVTPSRNPPDFRLVEYPAGDLMDACQLDAWYCSLAGKQSIGAMTERDQFRLREREQERIRRDTTTDDFPLPLAKNLKAAYRVYRLPPARGTGTLLLIAASADPKVPDSRPIHLAYRVSAVYPAVRHIIQLDTALTIPPGKHRASTTLLAYHFPAGHVQLTVAVIDSAAGSSALGVEDSLDLPDFSGSAPVLSDLLVGLPDSRVRWQDGGAAFPLSPGQTFREGATVTVAYAVRGFSGDVRTTIEIRRGDKARTSVSFTEPLDPKELLVQRRIGLGKLGWGNYTLRVTLTELATGRELSRETEIVVK